MTYGCSLRHTWERVRDATLQILENTNFAELARDAKGPWLEITEVGAASGRNAGRGRR